jgi:hypothetical protein
MTQLLKETVWSRGIIASVGFHFAKISPFYAMGGPLKCFYHTGAEYTYTLSLVEVVCNVTYDALKLCVFH